MLNLDFFFFYNILLRSHDWQGLSSLDSFGALGYYLSVECNNNLSFGKSFKTLIIEPNVTLVRIKPQPSSIFFNNCFFV